MVKTLKNFTPYELIEIALESAEKNIILPNQFRSNYNVNFTFLQLCNNLTKKTIWNKIVLTKEEYGIIKDNMDDKDKIVQILKTVKSRNTVFISNFEEKI